ncbi:MAG: hypothetical protein M3198_14530 [Actinomycetota bacterium]|nr:hypothetical protein [Actinomycetota bacterium]
MADEQDHHPPRPEALALLRVVPKLGPIAAQYLVDRHEYRSRRAEEFVDDVTRGARLDVAELFERIRNDPRLAAMFEQAVEAAVAEVDARKRKGLARALTSGLIAADDAEVDVAQLVLSTLNNLQPAHVRLLDLLKKLPPLEGHAQLSPGTPLADSDIHALWPGVGNALTVVAAQLLSWGLIINVNTGLVGGHTEGRYSVSPFGEAVYGYLEEEASGS